MARKFSQLSAAVEAAADADPERHARKEAYRRAIADALALGKVRESRAATQQPVADVMGATQAKVSRIERQEDLYLSTLRFYIEALGGHLEVAAVFPDHRILIADSAEEQPEPAKSQMSTQDLPRCN